MLSQVLLLGRGGARKNCANSWMEVHDKKGMTDGKRFHVLRVKNRFDPSLDDRPELLNGGYRDINIKLKIGFTEGKDGRAVVLVEGKLIENLHVAEARRLVALSDAIAALEAGTS